MSKKRIAQPRKKMGRPTIYSEEMAKRLCLAIATSSDGIRKICKNDPSLPAMPTIYKWLAEGNQDFIEQYARARALQAQILFDEIIEIADTPQQGVIVTMKGKKRETRTGDMVERARLRLDARKWALSKLLPRKYGERLDVGLFDTEDPLLDLIGQFDKRYEQILAEKVATPEVN